MNIIGLSGKRGVGKTTVANYLVTNYGYEKLSFADYLKECTKQLWDMEEFYFIDPAAKERPYKNYPWTPREFMIEFGKFMRKYDENYWLDSAFYSIPLKAVFDDVRFPNEAEKIQGLGGRLIRINRARELTPYKSEIDDISETSLDTFNFNDYILNNSTLESLYASIRPIVSTYDN